MTTKGSTIDAILRTQIEDLPRESAVRGISIKSLQNSELQTALIKAISPVPAGIQPPPVQGGQAADPLSEQARFGASQARIGRRRAPHSG